MIKHIIYLLLLFVCFQSTSQQLILEGNVSGYTYNPNNGLISKGGDVSLEGSLSGVKLEIFKNNKVVKYVNSNNDGDFKFQIPLGPKYIVQFSKLGYETVRFEFNLGNLENEAGDVTFKSFELILNKHIQYRETTEIGLAFEIYFDPKLLNFDIKEIGFKIGGNLSKKMDYDPLISLIKGSIVKNEPFLFASNKPKTKTVNSSNLDENKDTTSATVDTVSSLTPNQENSKVLNKEILNFFGDKTSISDKESIIKKLKQQLDLDKLTATTPEEYALIEEREALIMALSSELQLSRDIVAAKEDQLDAKNKQFWLLMLVFVIVLGVGVYVYLSFKRRELLNQKIIHQGERILSSINYAEKIQSALLPQPEVIKNILPNSFIFYKPKDVVSGDFYWIKEIDNRIIVAAVDCTGHGVPGAFMSMIGMTLLNQIVIIEKNLDPASILSELNKHIKDSLKQNSQDPFASQDGMDLSITIFDKNSSELTYAGAMNSIFLVSNQKVKELEVDKCSIGGFSFGKEGHAYKNQSIKMETDQSLYLMSDGFMDQFGGENKEKFNLSRLEALLVKINNKPMTEQKVEVKKALENWQGSTPQTDDILFIGMSFTN